MKTCGDPEIIAYNAIHLFQTILQRATQLHRAMIITNVIPRYSNPMSRETERFYLLGCVFLNLLFLEMESTAVVNKVRVPHH